MNKFLCLMISLLFIGPHLLAETALINNVSHRDFRGVKAIVNQDNVTEGYYTFYVDEKVSGATIKFKFVLFDLQLNEIKSTPVEISKYSQITNSAYNGKDFMFLFNDAYQNSATILTLDKDGNVLEKHGLGGADRLSSSVSIYPAKDGFFVIKQVKGNAYGYTIEKVDNRVKQIWEVKNMPANGYIGCSTAYADKDRLIVIQLTKPKLLSNKVKGDIVAFDSNSGKKLYNYPLYTGGITGIPSAYVVDEDNNFITGGMYFDGEKWDNTNSDGIFFMKLSPTGKKLVFEKHPWDGPLESKIKALSGPKFSISGKTKIFFHNIVEDQNGNYQIIGETFTKSYQMVSIALKDAITGRYIGNINEDDRSNKPFTFEVMDLISFSFSPGGKINNVEVIEKEHTKISCYTPYNYMGGLALAHFVNQFGWFNYAFVAKKENSDKQYIITSNFVDKDAYIGITQLNTGKVPVTKKIPINKKELKGGKVGVMSAEPGKLAIYVFDKKEESISIYKEAMP